MNRLLALAFLFAALCNPVAAGELEDMIAKAEQGDCIDQYDLGVAYYFGNGAPQDYTIFMPNFVKTSTSRNRE